MTKKHKIFIKNQFNDVIQMVKLNQISKMQQKKSQKKKKLHKMPKQVLMDNNKIKKSRKMLR